MAVFGLGNRLVGGKPLPDMAFGKGCCNVGNKDLGTVVGIEVYMVAVSVGRLWMAGSSEVVLLDW
jgi:hypothetical protein